MFNRVAERIAVRPRPRGFWTGAMGRQLVRYGGAGLVTVALSVTMALPAGAAGPVASGKWANKFCGAVGAWLVAVDEAVSVEPAPAGDLVAVSAQLDALLGETEAATRVLVKQVKKAGVPDLPHGAAIAKLYRKTYADLAVALAAARNALLSVERGSPDAGVSAVADAQEAFETALTDAQDQIEGAEVLTSKPLTKALRKEPSCVAITG